MYKIYINDVVMFDDAIDNENIFNTILNLEINKAGSLEFEVYEDNPFYDQITRMKTVFTVFRSNDIIFRGRVLSTEVDIFNRKKVTVEGEMAYFNDSVVRPFGYQDDEGSTQYSPSQLITTLIREHNASVKNDFRSFRLGSISVKDYDVPVDWHNGTYTKSSDFLSSLIESFGGYIFFRHEETGVYIDWLGTTELSDQTVEFSQNILDLNHSVNAEEMITAILPYGDINEETGYPTNISEMDVPESQYIKKENDYIYNKELYDLYGLIVENRQYEGYPADWLSHVVKDVQSLSGMLNTIEVSALDLSILDESMDYFMVGKRIHVVSENHSIDQNMIVEKLKINILNPSKSSLTFGSEYTIIDALEENIKDLRSENEKMALQTKADIEFVQDEIDDTNKAVATLSEKGQAIGVSYTQSVKQAKIFQPEGLNWAYFKTTSSTIRINCNATTLYPVQTTVNENLTDKIGYYAVIRVTEEGQTFYRPLFLKRILNGTGIKWYRIGDSLLTTEYHDDVYIIGSFSTNDGSAKLWGVARTVDEAGSEAFMEFLSTANSITDDEFKNYCENSGIDSIFKKIAVLEAFVNRLFANELRMTGEGILKSSNFVEAYDRNANSYYPQAGYSFKATPDERGIQCSLYNARMAVLKAIDAEFWKTTLHGIVDHDHFKTTSAGSGISSISFSEGSSVYFETDILTRLTDICKSYGYSNGILQQVSEGLQYILDDVTGTYHGTSFTGAVWHEWSVTTGVVNGKLHFNIPSNLYTLKTLRTKFTYGSESMDSDTMTTYYEVTDTIWNEVSKIPENNVCDSITGSITVGSTTLSASSSDPIRIVNTGSTVTFTTTSGSVSVSERSHCPTALHASGISTPTTWDGIEVKNILPRDSQKTYSIGTSSKKFTVWGAVFN